MYVCVWVCPHIVLQTGFSPQAGVSLLTESCQEPLPQPVNTTLLYNTPAKTLNQTFSVHQLWLYRTHKYLIASLSTCPCPGISSVSVLAALTSSSLSSMLCVGLLWSSGLLAMSSSSMTRLRVNSCVTNGCWRKKPQTDHDFEHWSGNYVDVRK